VIRLSTLRKCCIGFFPQAKFQSSFHHLERWRQAFVLMVIVFLAFQATGIVYKALAIRLIVPQKPQMHEEGPLNVKMPLKEPFEAYKVILVRNLFGSTDKAIGDKIVKPQGIAPLAGLLELHGIAVGEGKNGFAVFMEKSKNKQVLVRIGKQIAGATLLKVGKDNVILRYMDQEEVLKRRSASESQFSGRPGSGGGGVVGSAAGLSSKSITINRNELNASLSNIGQVLSQVQIRPYLVAGTPDGFVVNQIRQGSIFQRMGLQEGDIIQNLDDRKVRAIDDVISLFNTLRTAPAMNLTVKREGRQEKLAYTFN